MSDSGSRGESAAGSSADGLEDVSWRQRTSGQLDAGGEGLESAGVAEGAHEAHELAVLLRTRSSPSAVTHAYESRADRSPSAAPRPHFLDMDYGSAAAQYVDAFMRNVNWEEVDRRYRRALPMLAA